jgi:dynein heavy chain 1
VQGIKRQALVELRSMNSPPPMVKLALEAVCVLLGENVGGDWTAIRKVTAREDFMNSILEYNVCVNYLTCL